MTIAVRHEGGTHWSVHEAITTKTEKDGRWPDTAVLLCEPFVKHVHSLRGMPVPYAADIGDLRKVCPRATFELCPYCAAPPGVVAVRSSSNDEPKA